MSVAIAHDYLTQRGGAERVVLSMLAAFPDAPVHTLLYDPAGTFPEFAGRDVRASPLNRLPPLRRHHRLALPLLAPVVERMRIDADVVICSSSGWAHGVDASGAKIVYCHAPARWLYQPDAYLRGLGVGAQLAARMLHRPLVRWDKRATRTAARHVVNSTHVARSVRELYGVEAEVLPPPPALTPDGRQEPVPGLEPGYVLCVSRLLPYKNVDAVVDAFRELPQERLVVVGTGPDGDRQRRRAGPNVTFAGRVDDAALRWLYANCAAHVAASYEDYGLTPLEAASFGKPTAALRFGGFLDTLVEGTTGELFDRPDPRSIARTVEHVLARTWSRSALERHAARFSSRRFVERLRQIVQEATP